MIRLLVERGAVVDGLTSFGETSSLVAATLGHVDVLLLLFELGANPMARARPSLCSLVCRAASGGHCDVIELLVARNAPLAPDPALNYCPTLSAAARGHVDAVKLLVSLGADVNLANSFGQTALHLAAQNEQRDVVSLLLSLGARIDAPTNHGETPLFVVARRGALQMIRQLASLGADVNKADCCGVTPLMAATSMGNVDAVRALLELGADVGARAVSILSPSLLALARRADVAALLVAHVRWLEYKPFVLDVALAFAPLQLPPYVLLEIVDWLPRAVDFPDMLERDCYLRLADHGAKIRILVGVQRAVNRIYLARKREN